MTVADASWDAPTAQVRTVPRRKVRGLKLTAVPSWPLVTQACGGLSALTGVYMLWGLAVVLIVAGVAAVTLGALREAGRV